MYFSFVYYIQSLHNRYNNIIIMCVFNLSDEKLYRHFYRNIYNRRSIQFHTVSTRAHKIVINIHLSGSGSSFELKNTPPAERVYNILIYNIILWKIQTPVGRRVNVFPPLQNLHRDYSASKSKKKIKRKKKYIRVLHVL